MVSDYQPIDPREVHPEIVAQLRAMWARGLSVADLARFLIERGLHEIPVKMCFETAFCLDYGDAMAIGGWLRDGTGELSDKQLRDLLAPRIELTRPEWDESVHRARVAR